MCKFVFGSVLCMSICAWHTVVRRTGTCTHYVEHEGRKVTSGPPKFILRYVQICVCLNNACGLKECVNSYRMSVHMFMAHSHQPAWCSHTMWSNTNWRYTCLMFCTLWHVSTQNGPDVSTAWSGSAAGARLSERSQLYRGTRAAY